MGKCLQSLRQELRCWGQGWETQWKSFSFSPLTRFVDNYVIFPVSLGIRFRCPISRVIFDNRKLWVISVCLGAVSIVIGVIFNKWRKLCSAFWSINNFGCFFFLSLKKVLTIEICSRNKWARTYPELSCGWSRKCDDISSLSTANKQATRTHLSVWPQLRLWGSRAGEWGHQCDLETNIHLSTHYQQHRGPMRTSHITLSGRQRVWSLSHSCSPFPRALVSHEYLSV